MVQVSLTGPKTPASKILSENVETDQNIAVFVRCRPMKTGDKKNVVEVIPEQKSVRVNDRGNAASVLGNDKLYSRIFSFDNVFGTNTEQIEVYRSVVAPLIEQVIAGYNCTVFAYGQTGTGKTYTMEGERSGDGFSWEEDPLSGMIPRALHQLFETLPENTEHTIGVSFIELYNEELYDLLSPVDDTNRLKIYDDPVKKGSVIISGLEEINVHTKDQIYEILRKGSEKRQTAATLLNACSSRSHTIFSVTVHIKENSIDGEELLKIGKLNLVDLAGSENIGRSGASEKRAREAGNINQSLLTLGRVITCLTEKAPHIPYRESKLTRLLKDSLGGRTKTSIIATISPNVLDAEDTLSTLEYAQRAKKITNKPEVNQKLSKKTLLREYTAEIERLRRDLMACREKNGFFISEANYKELLEKNDSQAKEIQQKEAEVAALQADYERMAALFGETKEELEAKEAKLLATTETLKETQVSLKKTEENLEEQTYLLDEHSKNEKVLYSQAQDLLNFAENTSKDLQNLHRKVDCQKNLEDTNFSKINLFQQNFNAQMEHFLHLLDVGSDSLNECLSTIKPAINNGFALLTENITEIASNLVKTSKAVENFDSDFETVLQSDKFSVEKMSSNKEMISCLNESRLLYEQKVCDEIASTRSAFEDGLHKVSDVINLQRAEVENLLMKQSEYIQQFTAFRTTCIENMRKVMNNYFAAHNTEVHELKGEIEALKKSQKDFNTMKATKMSQIGQLLLELSECEKSSIAAADKSITTIISTIDNMAKENETEKQKLFNIIDETSNDLAAREKVVIDYIDKVDGLSCQNIQTNICEIDLITTDSQPRFEKIQKIIGDMSDDIQYNIDENHKICDEIIEALDCNLDQKQQIVAKMNKDVTKSISNSKRMTESTLSNISTTQENILKRVSMATNEATNWSRSYKRELITRSSDFDIFKSSELAKYVPTGTTPQKREMNYPQRLVITSPNEQVLSRFRKLMNEKKAAEVPLPDSDDLDNDVVSIDSGDSMNVENIAPLITDASHTSKEVNKKGNDSGEAKGMKNKEKAPRMKSKPLNEVVSN